MILCYQCVVFIFSKRQYFGILHNKLECYGKKCVPFYLLLCFSKANKALDSSLPLSTAKAIQQCKCFICINSKCEVLSTRDFIMLHKTHTCKRRVDRCKKGSWLKLQQCTWPSQQTELQQNLNVFCGITLCIVTIFNCDTYLWRL